MVTLLGAAGAVVGRFGSTVDTGLAGAIVGFALVVEVTFAVAFDTVAGLATFDSTFDSLLTLSVESLCSCSSALTFSSNKASVGRLAYPLG